MAQQYKVTLDTGKTALVKDMTVKMKNQAVEAAGLRAGESASATAFSSMLQDEVLRLLLISVDGNVLSGVQKEDLDSVFTYVEYQQLMLCLKDIMGVSEVAKKPKIEIVIINS